MQNLSSKTNFWMKKYHITASKKLGQNFLMDEQVIEKIVKTAGVGKKDLVIEIGPGLGSLTEELLEYAGKVLAIEIDECMIPLLKERFLLKENFELVLGDVLKLPLQDMIQQEKQAGKFETVKIVANLPYYITTPILMKLLEERLDIESITVMVQKEVAKRLTAKPGDTASGAISYAISYYTIPKEVTFVPKEAFLPSPEVDSEVIQLVIRKEVPIQVENEKDFFHVIKVSFMQRRKTLVNGLVNGKLFSKEECFALFEQMNLPKDVRGEKLNLEQFAQIANAYTKKKQ